MRWIIDLVLLAVLAMCIWRGYQRGLIVGIASIVSIVFSLYVACLLSGTFSYEVVSAVKPFVSGYMDRVISGDVTEAMGGEYTEETPLESRYSLNDIVGEDRTKAQEFAETVYKDMGVYPATAGKMAKEAVELSASDKVSLKQAVTNELCNRLVYVAGVILCFCILLILLTFIGNIPNLDFRLPNMARADVIGGTIAGSVKGMLFCMLLAWALKFMGILIGTDTMSHTLLGRLFIKIGFIAHFIGI